MKLKVVKDNSDQPLNLLYNKHDKYYTALCPRLHPFVSSFSLPLHHYNLHPRTDFCNQMHPLQNDCPGLYHFLSHSTRHDSHQGVVSYNLGTDEKRNLPTRNRGQVYAEPDIMYPGRMSRN